MHSIASDHATGMSGSPRDEYEQLQRDDSKLSSHTASNVLYAAEREANVSEDEQPHSGSASDETTLSEPEVIISEPAAKYGRLQIVVNYFERLKGSGKPGPVMFVWQWNCIPAGLFAGATLQVLAVIEAFGLQPRHKGLQSYLPSFGAACCIVMALSTTPGAQPRAHIPTHVFGAFLGVSWAHITKHLPTLLGQQLAAAFAVSILTVLMMLFGSVQPSASATACLGAFHLYGEMNDQGFMFMVAPALLGSCVIVFMGWLLINLVPWMHCYPVWW